MYKTVATSLCGMRDAAVIYSHRPENSSDNLADVHDFCQTSCPHRRSLSPMMIYLEIVTLFERLTHLVAMKVVFCSLSKSRYKKGVSNM